LSFRHFGSYQPRLWFAEISSPSAHGSTMAVQPFMRKDRIKHVDQFFINWMRDQKRWAEWLSPEQTAYALSQVQAAQALPSLTEYVSVAALLECRITLRDHLDTALVEAVTQSLVLHSATVHWNRIDSTNFASVVGAGVAACIDTTTGGEVLYLRFANEVATAITKARREAELPHSLLGLETHIGERVDELLLHARTLTLKQLYPQSNV
jgi:hypothetical protein